MKVRLQFKTYNFEINIVSKFTCFIGKDSGEGKSELYAALESAVQTGELEIQAPYPVSLATPATIEALLKLPTRHIFIVDEASVLYERVLRKLKDSIHLFICINRSLPLKLSYSYYGIYHVKRSPSGFEIFPANELNLVKEIPRNTESIITEAAEDRSEYQLLSMFGIKNLKAARGRNRIHKIIRNGTNQLVLADLANIGSAYSLLRKDCKRQDIKFYDYNSFEALLNDAPILQQFPAPKVDPFSFDSLEQYYSFLLSKRTEGTPYEYKHGKQLSNAYKVCSEEDLFNSASGKGILKYLKYYNLSEELSLKKLDKF